MNISNFLNIYGTLAACVYFIFSRVMYNYAVNRFGGMQAAL